MGESNSTSSSKSVFELIEDALGSTAQGRAFLDECGRRARSEETTVLLDAVARLERQVRARQANVDRDKLYGLVGQIEASLHESKLALLGAGEPRADEAARHRAPHVSSLAQETAASMFQAAELIQEIAWAMREAGFDVSLCDRLDDQTSAIYAACKRQELMLNGLSALEHAILRANACIDELHRVISPTPASPPQRRPSLVVDGDMDSDIEFVPSPVGEDTSSE